MIECISYKYNPFDHGIFMEIYLPKKSEYQGILYKTLTEGFELKNIKSSLEKNWDDIKKMMGSSYEYEKEYILEHIQPVFFGYSMYEVDGVFYDKNKIVEERTQVIRLMFKLDDIKTLSEKDDLEIGSQEAYHIRTMVDDYLNSLVSRKSILENTFNRYLDIIKTDKAILNEHDVINLAAKLKNWELSIVYFILGYIVHNICEEIKIICEEKEKEKEKDPEKVIWITSFWNLRVNRIELLGVN